MSNNLLLNKKVLVAEDNAISQMIVKHALLKLGVTADFANDGAEAIKKFEDNKYDLILMDLDMPIKNGYETTNYIRTQIQSNVPIIAMTASNLNGEDEKCYEGGMNGCISKPFTVDSLSSVIQNVLSEPAEINTDPQKLVGKNASIDLALLYDISGGDESFVAMMARTFLENMPATITKIEASLSNKNWEGLREAAHFAKSTLSVVKVDEMFEAVVAIEGYARTRSNLEKLPALVQQVTHSFWIAKELLVKRFG